MKLLLFACITISSPDTVLNSYKDYYASMGVIEQSETLFTRFGYFNRHIKIAENRLSRITPKTPPIEVYYLVPNEKIIFDADTMQSAFKNYLLSIYEWRNYAEQMEIDQILKDLEWRDKLYTTLAQLLYLSTSASEDGKRLTLEKIGDMIGHDNLRNGKFPRPLPDAAYNSVWFPIEQKEIDS